MSSLPNNSGSSAEYYISLFLNAVRADLDSPVTSNFGNRINDYRSQTQRFVEEIEEDNVYFTPVRKISKDIESSLTTLSKQLDELGLVFRDLADKWRQRSGERADNGTFVLSNMELLLKGECDLVKEQVRNWTNNMVHPFDLLCSAHYDLKHKAVDKACREYESKFAKAESDAKKHAKQSGHPRSQISHGELAEELTVERSMVQYELCKFMLNMGAVEDKRSSQLARHFAEFIKNQNQFHSEGQKLSIEFKRTFETLENAMDIHSTNACHQRNALFELKTRIENTSTALRPLTNRRTRTDSYTRNSRLSIVDNYGGTSSSSIGLGSFVNGENESLQDISIGNYNQFGNPLPVGFLYKKSNKKLHKQWQKRKCRIEDDCFWLSHSDESLPPAKLSLLVSDCKPSPEGSKMFDLYCRDRTYHLQAETESEAKKWVIALKQEIQRLKRELLNSESERGEVNNTGTTRREWNEWKKCVSTVRSLPGNSECADCGSDIEVQWLSNTGALVCIDCSGAHRKLGVHVSRIQSLDLDVISPVEFLVPLATGNIVINRIYEDDEKANLWKPRPGCSGSDRQNFIQQKYRDRNFLVKVDDPDKLMCTAISNLNVEKAYKALLSQKVSSTIYTKGGTFSAMIRQNNPSSLPIVQLCAQFGIFDPATQMSILNQCIEAENVDALCIFLYNRFGSGKQNFTSLKPLEELANKLGYSEILEVLRGAQTPGRCRLNQVTIPSSLIKSPSSSGSLSQSSSISPLVHPISDITADSSSSSVNVLMRNGTTIAVPKENSASVRKELCSGIDRRSASSVENDSRPSSAHIYSCSTYPPLSVSTSSFKGTTFGKCSNDHADLKEQKRVNAFTSAPSQVSRTQLCRSISKAGTRGEAASNHCSKFPLKISCTESNVDTTLGENEFSSVPSTPLPSVSMQSKPRTYHRSASEYSQLHTNVAPYRDSVEQRLTSGSSRKKHLVDSSGDNVDASQSTVGLTDKSRFLGTNPFSPPVNLSDDYGKQSAIESDLNSQNRAVSLKKVSKGASNCGVKLKPPIPTPRRTLALNDAAQKECVRRCRALYDCVADNPDELSFKRGDVIIVSKEHITGENDTWMEGYLAAEPHKKGVFPITFVTFQI